MNISIFYLDYLDNLDKHTILFAMTIALPYKLKTEMLF